MPKKIKIAINGRLLNKPYTGIGRYSFEIIKELALATRDQADLVVICEAEVMKPWGQILKNFSNLKIMVRPENRLLYLINKGLAKSFWEASQFYQTARRQKADLIFCPYPSALKRKEIPLVVTVHDAIPWLDKEYATASRLGKIYNKYTLKCFKTADQILTVSNFSKNEIIKIAPLLKNKIKVIYNGILPLFSRPVKNALHVMSRYGIKPDRPFLFYYGGFDKRKNVSRLVYIYKKWLEKELGMDLVLGGGKVLDNILFEKMEQLGGDGVHKAGFVSDEDLPAFLNSATAFINLSRYEGFNLPLAESLAAGCVSLVADLEVNREVGKNFPVYLNLKEKDEALAKKIIGLLGQEENYSDLKTLMGTYQNKYSWENAAKSVWEILNKVVYIK